MRKLVQNWGKYLDRWLNQVARNSSVKGPSRNREGPFQLSRRVSNKYAEPQRNVPAQETTQVYSRHKLIRTWNKKALPISISQKVTSYLIVNCNLNWMTTILNSVYQSSSCTEIFTEISRLLTTSSSRRLSNSLITCTVSMMKCRKASICRSQISNRRFWRGWNSSIQNVSSSLK